MLKQLGIYKKNPKMTKSGLKIFEKLLLKLELWWLIASAPVFWGRGPGLESGIAHNDHDALQDHCVIM